MSINGEHTRRVILQKRTVSQDPDSGQKVESWGVDRSLYANFWDRHSRQGHSDGQIITIQDTRCRVRYVPQLDRRVDNQAEVNNRILDGDVVWKITSIVPEGRRKHQLMTLERKDDN